MKMKLALLVSVVVSLAAATAYAAPPVEVTKSALPTGAATSANQVTANGYLATIATAAAGTGPTTTGNLAATLSMSTATTTKIITGDASKSTYVTAIDITVDAATVVLVVKGTGTNCGTGTTTIAQYTFPANGGITKGGGMANILPAVAASTDVCITVSSSANTKINASYVQQ